MCVRVVSSGGPRDSFGVSPSWDPSSGCSIPLPLPRSLLPHPSTGVLEAELLQRAQLTYTRQVIGEVGQAAGAAAGAVRRARLGLQLTGLLGAIVSAGSGAVKRRAQAVAMASAKASLAASRQGEAAD